VTAAAPGGLAPAAPTRPVRSAPLPQRWVRQTALAVAAAVVVAAAGYGVERAGGASDALGPGVVEVGLDIDRSEFSARRLRVREGTLLQIDLRNLDPIAHELVVGDDAVHRAHERGDEGRHPPRPGELSVGPGDTGRTFVALDDPGTYRFACHLPGHVAYGMTGEIEVVPAD
jgi:uncharacterized cupredoxin-like copper-binding protein